MAPYSKPTALKDNILEAAPRTIIIVKERYPVSW